MTDNGKTVCMKNCDDPTIDYIKNDTARTCKSKCEDGTYKYKIGTDVHCIENCKINGSLVPVDGEYCNKSCRFYAEKNTSYGTILQCYEQCGGETPYQLKEYEETKEGEDVVPVRCVPNCAGVNSTYQFYKQTAWGPACVTSCTDSAVGYQNMYECVSACDKTYLYTTSLPGSSITVCVKQCPNHSPQLDSEVYDQTYPKRCIPLCKSVGKYMYTTDNTYYCVANCSVYGQYHSAVGAGTEAKCMAQCQYLTYVGDRTHCIDTCNYIVQYPNMTEEFCLEKCDGFAFSMNYSLPQCADKSCLLPRCVDKCPVGYYAEGGNCTMIRDCGSFFSQSNECLDACPTGYFQYQYRVKVCIDTCVGYVQPDVLTHMKECVTGKQCSDKEAPFYSLPEKKCVASCSGYYYAESSHTCLYNCL